MGRFISRSIPSPHLPFLLLLLRPLLVTSMEVRCSPQEYTSCIAVADPLVRDARLVFPDNMNDISIVCDAWNELVNCLSRFTSRCFNDQLRREFNKAIESPIESVHRMCTDQRYQKEYLRYAPCIKSTTTDKSHCGLHYSLLVEQVEQGGVISKSTLCCSHDKFRECVQQETRRICDRGVADGSAAQFARHVLDKAFSFLQDQCSNYIPNANDCPPIQADPPYFDPLVVSVSSSEVYPWSTVQGAAGKEMPQSYSTAVSWMPSTIADQASSSIPDSRVLGTRTRPASYGRSGSWSEQPQMQQSTPSTLNSVPRGNSNDSPSPASVRPDWTSNWGSSPSASPGIQQEPQSSTAWYPVAGSQLVNEVEEPNQQGLSKPRNSASQKQLFSLTIIATVLTAYC